MDVRNRRDKTNWYAREDGTLVRDDFGMKEARMIREIWEKGGSMGFLAKRFHITRDRVRSIVEGKTWKEEGNAEKTE